MKSIEEILAKMALFRHLLQVNVGCGNDPHVDANRFHAAEAHELALLHDAEQLGLRLERDVANLVEKDAAFVSKIAEALLRIDRAREGAPDVAEERRLEQIGRRLPELTVTNARSARGE